MRVGERYDLFLIVWTCPIFVAASGLFRHCLHDFVISNGGI